MACYNLAMVTCYTGNKERPEELYNEQYKLNETSLGELHPNTLKLFYPYQISKLNSASLLQAKCFFRARRSCFLFVMCSAVDTL